MDREKDNRERDTVFQARRWSGLRAFYPKQDPKEGADRSNNVLSIKQFIHRQLVAK
jgi:hypothetical protein